VDRSSLVVHVGTGRGVRRKQTRRGIDGAERLDELISFAGDSDEAKATFAAFLESLDMRPLDAGGLEMAYVLEWAGILLVGLARNGAGFDIALGAEVL